MNDQLKGEPEQCWFAYLCEGQLGEEDSWPMYQKASQFYEYKH